jgi:hypothetical protein
VWRGHLFGRLFAATQQIIYFSCIPHPDERVRSNTNFVLSVEQSVRENKTNINNNNKTFDLKTTATSMAANGDAE